MSPIRLLIVDDSLLIRTFLRDLFLAEPDFELVGAAADPYQARDLMRQTWPDVITLDVEMPKMNGIEFLRKVMGARPTPVVMLSTLTRRGADITMQALEIGAFDCIPKPEMATRSLLAALGQEIVAKVRLAAASTVHRQGVMKTAPLVPKPGGIDPTRAATKAVVIGSSTGGVQALVSIFSRLPPAVPGIALVQHMPPSFLESLASQLEKKSALRVKVAGDGEPVLPGHVLIAPGDRHLEIMRHREGFLTRLVQGPPVGYHLPAVNHLFMSAAHIGGPRILGVILTGMGEDGAAGMLEMRQRECLTVGQDRESCVVYGMPKRALEMGGVAEQLPLTEIPGRIVRFAEGGGR